MKPVRSDLELDFTFSFAKSQSSFLKVFMLFTTTNNYNKNTFCGTRYLSHCCSLHGTVVAVT